MAKLITWDADMAKQELSKRLSYAKDSRAAEEAYWEENERTVYNTKGGIFPSDVSLSFQTESELSDSGPDNSSIDVGTNYTFKNLRFIHSQLSSNPPSVAVRPTSNDVGDRRKADAADRLIRYAIRKYTMQDRIDTCSLNTLIYGTGFMKTLWDSSKGEVLEFDESTGEMTMEGDIGVAVPSPWDIFLDPDASCWEEVRFVFERITLPYEDACYRFPGKKAKEILDRLRKRSSEGQVSNQSALRHKKYDVIEIFEYWEKGLPANGLIGRFGYCTAEGDLLEPLKPNPFRFRPVREDVAGSDGETAKKLPERAQLPYHIFTDVDVPSRVWGRSVVAYASTLQDNVNRLDTVVLDALAAHGVPRLICPEGTEIADESITNSAWDIIYTTGPRDPHFIAPMALPSNISEMRDRMKLGIDDMQGVNENMFGQQSREQSGFSMQYATNQGNMIRRRLFNKYVFLVESVYKAFLNLVRKHWTTEQTIYVLGKEKAFEAIPLKGADIDGGFDLVVEYGATFSLDPTMRRQEMLTMMPLFEKAGMSPRAILNRMKLNETDGMYDTATMAYDRQMEIFEEMMADGVYLPPKELQDHGAMLEYAYSYVMTSEYKYLDENTQALIDKHILEREQFAAKGPRGQAAVTGQPPAQPAALQGPAAPAPLT